MFRLRQHCAGGRGGCSIRAPFMRWCYRPASAQIGPRGCGPAHRQAHGRTGLNVQEDKMLKRTIGNLAADGDVGELGVIPSNRYTCTPPSQRGSGSRTVACGSGQHRGALCASRITCTATRADGGGADPRSASVSSPNDTTRSALSNQPGHPYAAGERRRERGHRASSRPEHKLPDTSRGSARPDRPSTHQQEAARCES